MNIRNLGEARIPSPQLRRTVSESVRVPSRIIQDPQAKPHPEFLFELAGPREKLFFDAARARAGVVTCGGLCPGLNNVIRSLFLELYHGYGLKQVLGFRDGYQGLDPDRCAEPIGLTCELVDDIHKEGGTILGTSRGPVDPAVAVNHLQKLGIEILFTIGGDGTQRGAAAIFEEAQKRGYPLAVVGIPKTIDNDIHYVSRTFGFLTSVEESARILECAHTEAHSVKNGVALVKLMGRDAGFIAASATIASQDVNFTLVPEVPFRLEGERGFLPELKRRILRRAHALVVVAEGAGQDLIQSDSHEKDASGNVKQKDIGGFLRAKIEDYFKQEGVPIVIRYFDPSYIIRSVPADSEDAILCDLFARNAAHAAMAGKTGLIIGLIHDLFVHVPIEMATREKKRMNPQGAAWHAVLATTGQPAEFK